ncbi:alpha/beta hydrolase [Cupriavidus sp. SW-Y-13]|uniref:alpha/beta hydrolase n=1 Tax=Cupriavidus sp. SW-Y-13 TaxID=2653854 RepID=UPI0013659F52|nr:alpha/beta hydrolase [Cupriavidus sp. SW-Y-13]MWL88289.1 alpha/beta hydrolase fold domain-containing protein [Cupriavidus sp. SW-Y-13]
MSAEPTLDLTVAASLAALAALPSQDPAFYAQAYDNRANVPDNAVHMARWAADSALVRAGAVTYFEDLAYGDAASETLDYFPANSLDDDHPPPLLVFVHGGYFRALDKRDHSFVANVPTRRGVSVAVVNYALCPAVSVETIVSQVLQSVAWLYREAERLGHDRRRIFVAGHSVGGHLVAMLMAARWPDVGADLPVDLIKGGLSISGLYDMEPLRRTGFLQSDLQLTEAAVARLSPAYMTPATGAPLITAVGELESSEYHRHNALIRAAWPDNAREDIALPGKHHFTAMDDLMRDDSVLTRALLGMIAGV